jgi:hypothetical protein
MSLVAELLSRIARATLRLRRDPGIVSGNDDRPADLTQAPVPRPSATGAAKWSTAEQLAMLTVSGLASALEVSTRIVSFFSEQGVVARLLGLANELVLTDEP